jgi:hypothetical protein
MAVISPQPYVVGADDVLHHAVHGAVPLPTRAAAGGGRQPQSSAELRGPVREDEPPFLDQARVGVFCGVEQRLASPSRRIHQGVQRSSAPCRGVDDVPYPPPTLEPAAAVEAGGAGQFVLGLRAAGPIEHGVVVDWWTRVLAGDGGPAVRPPRAPWRCAAPMHRRRAFPVRRSAGFRSWRPSAGSRSKAVLATPIRSVVVTVTAASQVGCVFNRAPRNVKIHGLSTRRCLPIT